MRMHLAATVIVLFAPISAWAQADVAVNTCLDARAVRSAQQIDARTLAVRLQDGARYQLTLGSDCPNAVDKRRIRLLARGGRVCGVDGDAVRNRDSLCPIIEVLSQSAREHAQVLRESRGSSTDDAENTALDTIVVEGRGERRRFVGSHEECINIRALRAWSEDTEGVRVEVSPQQSGGYRHYRLELAGACGDLANAEMLELISGVGLGVICGNPGDRLKLSRSQPSPLGLSDGDTTFARPKMQAPAFSEAGCAIAAVYPLDED